VSIPYRSAGGHVALIEREHGEPPRETHQDPITGVVDSWNEGILTVSGVDSSDLPEGAPVVVSIFASDALYRSRAVAHWAGAGQLTMDRLHDLERIQRRRWPRYRINLDVTLASLDGPITALRGIRGQTLDIGMGGVRTQTQDRLPPGEDVSVMVALPDGKQLVARSTVIAVNSIEAGFEYRLAFGQLDDLDTANLTALLDTLPDPGPPAGNQSAPATQSEHSQPG
jgi:PilZ domain